MSRTFRLVKKNIIVEDENVRLERKYYTNRYFDKTPIQAAKKIFTLIYKSYEFPSCIFSIKDIDNKKIYTYTGFKCGNTFNVKSCKKKIGKVKKEKVTVDLDKIDKKLYTLTDLPRDYVEKIIDDETLATFSQGRIQKAFDNGERLGLYV